MTTVGTHQVGDRVRYVGTYKTGTVQSTWWVRGLLDMVRYRPPEAATRNRDIARVYSSRPVRIMLWTVWILSGVIMLPVMVQRAELATYPPCDPL